MTRSAVPTTIAIMRALVVLCYHRCRSKSHTHLFALSRSVYYAAASITTRTTIIYIILCIVGYRCSYFPNSGSGFKYVQGVHVTIVVCQHCALLIN